MCIVRTWPAESAYTRMNDPHDRTDATCLLRLVPFCSLAKRAWPECTGLGSLPHLHFMQSQFPSSSDWKSGLVRFPSLADWSNKFVRIEGINGTHDWISEYPLRHLKRPNALFFFFSSFLTGSCVHFLPQSSFFSFSFFSDEITCTLPSPLFFLRDYVYTSDFISLFFSDEITCTCTSFLVPLFCLTKSHAFPLLSDEIMLGMYIRTFLCLMKPRSACTLPSSFPCFVWRHHARRVHFLPYYPILNDGIMHDV